MNVIILLWFAFSLLVGKFARSRRNRNPYLWFLISLALSPLLAILWLALLEPAYWVDWEVRERRFRRRVYTFCLILGLIMAAPIVMGLLS